MTRPLAVLVMLLFPRGAASQPVAVTQPTPIAIAWTDTEPLPVGVAGHAFVNTVAGPLSIGGTAWKEDQRLWLTQCWQLDPAAGVWRDHTALPRPLAYPLIAQRGKDLYLIGGADEAGGRSDTLIVRDGERVPDRSLPKLPHARALAFGGAVRNWIVLAGGAPSPSLTDLATDAVVRLDLDAAQPRWIEAAPVPGGPIILAGSAPVAGDLYVFGGMSRRGKANPLADTAAAYRYDPVRDQWNSIAPLPGRRRGATAVALDDRFIVVLGGCITESGIHTMLDEVLLYDTVTDRYHPLQPLPYAAMLVGAVRHGDLLFVFGGEDRARSRTMRSARGSMTILPDPS